MNATELADAMEIRASIRRQATSRKSVQENANDRLADQLDEAATMLRQQQAEIEALKKDNKELHAIAQRMAMAESDARKSLQWFKDAKEMNNEPYGWVKNGEYVLYIEKPDSVFNYIPLYTHQYERPHNTVLVPCDKLAEMQAEIEALKQSKFKDDNKVNFELTDEEIDAVGDKVSNLIDTYAGRREFARAILRKAQEK